MQGIDACSSRTVSFLLCSDAAEEDVIDNPFRPGGGLSREADIIVQMIKAGKPITPTSPTREDIRELEAELKQRQESQELQLELERRNSSSSPLISDVSRSSAANGSISTRVTHEDQKQVRNGNNNRVPSSAPPSSPKGSSGGGGGCDGDDGGRGGDDGDGGSPPASRPCSCCFAF